MKNDSMITSESVTEGHPDKLCDQISDAIVDHVFLQDRCARIRAECAVSSAIVFIATRFATHAVVDFSQVARKVIDLVGYTGKEFNARTCSILASTQERPRPAYPQFNEHVLPDSEVEKISVKNQVTVFGFACDQTATLMPLPITLAHKLARRLTEVRTAKVLPYVMPDGKVQVGVEYTDRTPARIHSVTVTAGQEKEGRPDAVRLQKDIQKYVIDAVFEDERIQPDRNTRIFVNPDGYFMGGPSNHSGLTGRKNAIDTYGEYSRHSGKALSGKDPLRIDRSGAYAARHAAKNVVAAGLARECEITLSYSIGLTRPVSLQVETFGTGKIPDAQIRGKILDAFDFRLAAILKRFNLRDLPAQNPDGFYRKLAAYGQVGRQDLDLPWEKTDRAGDLA